MILYARHGESTWNAAGRWQGQADPPLSARGRLQAQALAERLAADPQPSGGTGRAGLAWIATSPLARARDTAAVVAAHLELELHVVADLRELDAGSWSGLTRRDVEARHPEVLARFLAGDDALEIGGGESRAALRTRVRAALGALAARAAGRPFGVVGHLGALRSLVPDADLGNAEFVRLPADLLDPDTARRSGALGLGDRPTPVSAGGEL